MRTRTAVGVTGAVLAVLLLTVATPAAAHNTLQTATPAERTQLTTAPKEVTLQFAQRLNPTFTTIVLSDAGQRRIPTGTPVIAGTKGTISIDQPLANGVYTVAYRVVSADGHPVQGSYQFTVADPAGPPPPAGPPTADPPTADPAAAASDSAGGPPALLLAAGALGAVLAVVVAVIVAVIVVVARRRDRTTGT